MNQLGKACLHKGPIKLCSRAQLAYMTVNHSWHTWRATTLNLTSQKGALLQQGLNSSPQPRTGPQPPTVRHAAAVLLLMPTAAAVKSTTSACKDTSSCSCFLPGVVAAATGAAHDADVAATNAGVASAGAAATVAPAADAAGCG